MGAVIGRPIIGSRTLDKTQSGAHLNVSGIQGALPTFQAKKKTQQAASLKTSPSIPVRAIPVRTKHRFIKPPALKPGDTIAIVSPATPVSAKEMKEDIAYLRSQGFRVVQYAKTDWFNKHYLSDTDQGRAQAINKAFANPEVKAIFSSQGGGGTFRPDFLKNIDWELIRNNPKIFTGFSDITFLHHAMHRKANLVTFHTGFPSREDDTQLRKNTKAFWSMVAPNDRQVAPLPLLAGNRYKCMVPGQVTGKLIGGNLSLMAATIGTPYQVPLNGNEIVFLEDWNDDYENVDRLFSQLALHGFWDKIEGLIIGEFKNVPRKRGDFKLPWEKFITDVLKEAKKRRIPTGYHFPIGHGGNNRPIPMGVEAHFNSKNGTLTFLESPVS